MDYGYCPDTVLAFLDCREYILIMDMAGLEVQQAGNDLEIVFYTMVNFPQEHFFFMKRYSKRLLHTPAEGNFGSKGFVDPVQFRSPLGDFLFQFIAGTDESVLRTLLFRGIPEVPDPAIIRSVGSGHWCRVAVECPSIQQRDLVPADRIPVIEKMLHPDAECYRIG